MLLSIAALALAGTACGTPVPALPHRSPPIPTLGQRLLQSSALPPGYHAILDPQTVENPTVWAANNGLPGTPGAAESARLRSLGFMQATREDLYAEGGTATHVSSVVEQFNSPAGAAAEVGARFGQAASAGSMPGQSFSTFAVPGIPGARGYQSNIPDTTSQTIIWSDGPYFYLISATGTSGDPNTPTRSQLISAANHHYKRVHGVA